MQVLDWKGIKIGDKFTMVFRQKVNDVYTNFTGNTFRFQIRTNDGTLLTDATIANGKIVLSTTTVTNDTVTITIPGSETEAFERGSYRYELENLTVEKTLIGGKINFLTQFSYPT
jgi:hypothetical protein